ncbi:hypothetical protein CROQUDRAFT_93429 [Cronartium quercuum f. sp. fusiforme G11]|uniref:SIT4 phosphatase-associated family protein n=1 Tax=Cronartium quercuum f. sp. fusiforme G11 TaxID=708437 RepID=A0A9P6TBM6_9BASI|nr:hypothetical protein CROQUDRAFT_93429 [Cronartium quercuum f. sp. fusiforme G11]
MAFWRFGFHSQSAIDTILSSSAANNNGQTTGGCSTPSSSNPSILLDKLLDEDDLLQEIKAQHPKLIEFLGTKDVVLRLLGYISGEIFDDEESDILEESDLLKESKRPNIPDFAMNQKTMGESLLNSIRNRNVSDKISSLLIDALDSEGRTPEDRAKLERRKIRFPYICTEIISTDLWNITNQILSDLPNFHILTKFWDSVLNQAPIITTQKSIQIGYWSRTNIILINSKPQEMIKFIKSYTNVIPKLLSHFHSSPIVDLLFRIIQLELNQAGVIDWLIDETDFIELIISFLHPSRSPELHLIVADFLKNIISFCTTNPTGSSASPISTGMISLTPKSPINSPILSQNPTSETFQNINALSDKIEKPSLDDQPTFITMRLMRELTNPKVIENLLSYGLDTKIHEGETIITNQSITSSLINSLSIIIDLIRRNNSDFSEHQILIHSKNSQKGPAIVPLMSLLETVIKRLPDLQNFLKCPLNEIKPIKTSAGSIIPLKLERFRIIELYAELLHCSNMSMVNRSPSSSGPIYDSNGFLESGLEQLLEIFEPNSITEEEQEEEAQSPSHCEVMKKEELPLDPTCRLVKKLLNLNQSEPKPESTGGVESSEPIQGTKFFEPLEEEEPSLEIESSELVEHLFIDCKIIEKILEGLKLNHIYGLISNNVRLGYMAHLILISEEINKSINNNSKIFPIIYEGLKNNKKWQEFILGEVAESKANSIKPLGGIVPINNNFTTTPKNLMVDEEIDNNKVDGHTKYFTEHVKVNKSNQFSSSDDEEEDGSDEDDHWSNGKRKTGKGRANNSVISNPTPFGFDDRFDAPTRSFLTRFSGTEEDDDEEDGIDGFGDDFGPFSDSAAIHQVPIYDPFTLTTPKAGPSNKKWSKDCAGEGEGVTEQEEEEWGDFRTSESEGVIEQDIWTDFDLGQEIQVKQQCRSRAGSASSADEPFGPGVKANNVENFRDDGKLEVRISDGSLITVPMDEVMSAVVLDNNEGNS